MTGRRIPAPHLRLEIGNPLSRHWPWVRRLMRKFPSYKCTTEDGFEIHSIEAVKDGEYQPLAKILSDTHGWKCTALYFDGVLIARLDAYYRLHDYLRIRGDALDASPEAIDEALKDIYNARRRLLDQDF